MLSFSKIYHDLHFFADKALYSLAEIWQPLFAKIYLLAGLALNFSLWIFTWLFYRQVKGDVTILHFNVDFGIDLVGDPKSLFAIPALGLFIIVFNFFLLFIFVKNKNFKFLAQLILLAGILANVFLALALGPIYITNFN